MSKIKNGGLDQYAAGPFDFVMQENIIWLISDI